MTSQCAYSTDKKNLLQVHSKRNHFKPTDCPLCGETQPTYRAYHVHLNKHSSSTLRHQCPDCSYASQTASDLKSHRVIHSQSLALLSCPKCNDFRCKRKSELNRHIRLKHDDSGKKYPCRECDYVGMSKQHLDRHVKTHGGLSAGKKDTFQCRLCDFQCGSMESIRKHVLKTKVHAGASVYECEYCDFRTDLGPKFRQHLALQHMELFKTLIKIENHVKSYFSSSETRLKKQ